MRMTERTLFALSTVVLLFASAHTVYAGEVKHYPLPEVEGTDTRTLSIYLPEGYGNSNASYPVLYLLHGDEGSNLTFLGKGYNSYMSDANVAVILDRLLLEKKVDPMIVVCPDMTNVVLYDEYLLDTVIPFVEKTFRTMPTREFRAVAGHSMGGYHSLYLALMHPDMFCIAGGLASYIEDHRRELAKLVDAYDRRANAMVIWLYAGAQDENGTAKPSRDLATILNAHGLPATYVEDDGDHINKVAARLAQFLEYLSKSLKP